MRYQTVSELRRGVERSQREMAPLVRHRRWMLATFAVATLIVLERLAGPRPARISIHRFRS